MIYLTSLLNIEVVLPITAIAFLDILNLLTHAYGFACL